VAGPYWLENLGDGQFRPHLLIDADLLQSANLKAICRIAIADIDGNGRPDILFTVENVDWNVHKAFFSPVGWLENTGSPGDKPFNLRIIDKVRSPHSISVADLDGDGKMEVIVGEHDPFKPYRSESRLLVYKQADAHGITWSRFPVDNRFEHHDGAKIIELSPGNLAIISHGWMEPTYVHIWERSSS
jgi:FG-GAP repeat